MFYEFLYYVFDSLLIPLLRGNFYVTESNKHKYRLFYFRHDVWRNITEPAVTALKANMFEEIKVAEAQAILDSRRLGSSNLRLLPKDTTLRPIMNLRRRIPMKGNKKTLGPSINTVMGPVHSALSLQTVRQVSFISQVVSNWF
jgi:telomerase reverse transcriptase